MKKKKKKTFSQPETPSQAVLRKERQADILEHIKDACYSIGIKMIIFNFKPLHIRVRSVDFWPATQRCYSLKTKEKARGIEHFWRMAELPGDATIPHLHQTPSIPLPPAPHHCPTCNSLITRDPVTPNHVPMAEPMLDLLIKT